MKLTRRRMLQLALAVGAAGSGAYVYEQRRAARRPYDRTALAEHLHEVFGYLQPDPAGVTTFVDQYLEHYNPRPRRTRLPHVEETFLMSTDYFQTGQPAAGPIHFVMLYRPDLHPCYNPLVTPERS
jgi:hypothetical protein